MMITLIVVAVTGLFLWFLWKKVLPLFRGRNSRNRQLIRSQSNSRARRL